MQPNSTLPRAAQAALVLSVLISGCASDVPLDRNQVAPAPQRTAAPSAEPPSDPCDRPRGGTTLFDLELNGTAEEMVLSDDRIVAASDYGWALWDKNTARLIKNGGKQHNLDLVGDTLLTNGSDSFTLWNARDGAERIVVATSELPGSAQLSRDGSYVFVPRTDAVAAWSLTGKLLLNRAGWYAEDGIFAAPGELRVARFDVNHVETIAIDSGNVRTSAPYEGSFAAWFVDGTHFITLPSKRDAGEPMLRVYTKDATLIQSIRSPNFSSSRWNFGGENGHFWLTDYIDGHFRFSVYRLGQPAPVQTVDDHTPIRATRSSTTILHHQDDYTIQLLDLRGGAPTVTKMAPHEPTSGILTDDAGRWFFPGRGVVYEGSREVSREPARVFGCGSAAGIAGGGERLAMATGHGVTRLYSFRGGQPKLIWKHLGVYVTGLAFMGDGRYLIVRGLEDGDAETEHFTVRIYEFDQDDRLVGEVRHPVSSSFTSGSLSAAMSGTHYTQLLCKGFRFDVTCERKIMGLDGPLPWGVDESLSATSPALMSPSGALLAVRTYRGDPIPTFAIYQDGALLREISGSRPRLWLSDDRLLVDAEADRQKIVDLNGAVIAELPEPINEVADKEGVGVFHDDRSVYRDRDGKLLWSASHPPHRWMPRATVGSRFAYVDENTVRIESFASSLDAEP